MIGDPLGGRGCLSPRWRQGFSRIQTTELPSRSTTGILFWEPGAAAPQGPPQNRPRGRFPESNPASDPGTPVEAGWPQREYRSFDLPLQP